MNTGATALADAIQHVPTELSPLVSRQSRVEPTPQPPRAPMPSLPPTLPTPPQSALRNLVRLRYSDDKMPRAEVIKKCSRD